MESGHVTCPWCRIHLSATARELLARQGGYRCEARGTLDLGVSNPSLHTQTTITRQRGCNKQILIKLIQPRRGQMETHWLIGVDNIAAPTLDDVEG